MHQRSELRFRSAREGWIALVLWIATAVCFVSPFAIPFASAPFAAKAVAIPLLLLSAAFCLWCLLGTWYGLTESELIVAFGPLRRRIALTTIRSALATRDVVAAPALSSRRIEIHLDDSVEPLQISPTPPDQFLEALRARAAHLET